MKIRDNGSGRESNFYPHTVRANGTTCPQYVEIGNCKSCEVTFNNIKTKFYVWEKPTSDRVNFEIDGQWYFVDDSELNGDVRRGMVVGRKYETNL